VPVEPVALFFATARIDRCRLGAISEPDVVLFDRLRILDYAPTLSHLSPQLSRWVRRVLRSYNYPSL
jgi:hypothetical protein